MRAAILSAVEAMRKAGVIEPPERWELGTVLAILKRGLDQLLLDRKVTASVSDGTALETMNERDHLRDRLKYLQTEYDIVCGRVKRALDTLRGHEEDEEA
jgi:hypothetical protein